MGKKLDGLPDAADVHVESVNILGLGAEIPKQARHFGFRLCAEGLAKPSAQRLGKRCSCRMTFETQGLWLRRLLEREDGILSNFNDMLENFMPDEAAKTRSDSAFSASAQHVKLCLDLIP